MAQTVWFRPMFYYPGISLFSLLAWVFLCLQLWLKTAAVKFPAIQSWCCLFMLCCFPTAFWRLTASWKGLFQTFNSGQRFFGCVVDWWAEELSYITLWLREGWIFFKQTSVSACLVFVVCVLAAVPYKAFACCDLVLCLLCSVYCWLFYELDALPSQALNTWECLSVTTS